MEFLYAAFLKIFNMGIMGGVMVLAVLAIRLALFKAPRKYSYFLWGIVLFRLLCPVSFSSAFSVLNFADAKVSDGGVEFVSSGDMAFTRLEENKAPKISKQNRNAPEEKRALFGIPLFIWVFVWLLGMAALAGYNLFAMVKLRQKISSAMRLWDNVYLSDEIAEPFVFGLFFPRIYLPSLVADDEREYVILHERFHISRKDYLIRLAAFFALCLHWLNPLAWVAFVLSGRDMEISCDEAVLRTAGRDIRADYASSLLKLSAGGKRIAGMPPAFGSGDVKSRIKHVMRFQKQKAYVAALAAAICVFCAACLSANPKGDENEKAITDTETETDRQLSIGETEEAPSVDTDADLDTDMIMEHLLEVICSDPKESSNPQDYIRAHDTEYRELLYYGEFTVDYCSARFANGDETGLEGHVMARVCEELLGTKGKLSVDAESASTGQEWYDALSAYVAEEIKKEEDEILAGFGVPIALPQNENWILNPNVAYLDENRLRMEYYDGILEGRCELRAAKDGEIDLPELEEGREADETWEGETQSGQTVTARVYRLERRVIAAWKYENCAFAIVGDASAQKEDVSSVPKAALEVIRGLE